MYHAISHISKSITISESQSYEYFDNQEYTTPTQSGRKKNVILPFLATKTSKTKMATGL